MLQVGVKGAGEAGSGSAVVYIESVRLETYGHYKTVSSRAAAVRSSHGSYVTPQVFPQDVHWHVPPI